MISPVVIKKKDGAMDLTHTILIEVEATLSKTKKMMDFFHKMV